MEYLNLGDLQNYLTEPLPEDDTRQITSQIVEGLNFMHEQRFVHRDLKPQVSNSLSIFTSVSCVYSYSRRTY